ncbi:uncharacterized protein METZ01_LOCUS245117, partial [marine metagenome]
RQDEKRALLYYSLPLLQTKRYIKITEMKHYKKSH